MRFLTLYTPAGPQQGPPGPEGMARMGTSMEASINSGVLVAAAGAVTSSAASGMRLRLANGKFDVETGSSPSKTKQVGGWAILSVDTPDHLVEVARQFLQAAGDGDVEVMEIAQAPIP